jgi:hypothetical protein
MAKRISTGSKKITAPRASTPVPATPVASTPVRNTAIPKELAPVRPEITHEMISRRAYEIYASGNGGTADENWSRAERELRAL